MRTVADADAGNTRIDRHLQIMRCIADHDCLPRGKARFGENFQNHLRVGLRQAFFGSARVADERAETCCFQRTVDAGPAFCRRDRHPPALRIERGDQLVSTCIKFNGCLACFVMAAICQMERCEEGFVVVGFIRKQQLLCGFEPQTDDTARNFAADFGPELMPGSDD